MKFLIIEPHPDDTCLSFLFFIRAFQKEHDISLVTLTWNHEKDSAKFCDQIRIKYLLTDKIEDVHAKYKIPPSLLKKESRPFQFQINTYLKSWPDTFVGIISILASIPDKEGFDFIFTVAGISHPFHVLVSQAVQKIFPINKIYYFLEQPYIGKVYGKILFNDSELKKVKSIYPRFGRNDKIKIFLYNYPGEKSTLKWDRNIFLTQEEIICNKEGNLCLPLQSISME